MVARKEGQFFGNTNQHWKVNGLILTEATYTHDYVDWHYHERPYFTFLLNGQLIEKSQQSTYHCTAGDLLFHNWQDAHCNQKPPVFTRGFHIELEHTWLADSALDLGGLEGNLSIENPATRLSFYKIYRLLQGPSEASSLEIEGYLLDVLIDITKQGRSSYRGMPRWAKLAAEYLADSPEAPDSIRQLAERVGVHPVHLSRDFAKYFGYSPAEYRRKVRLQGAAKLLSSTNQTIASISYECGFADQSHLGRQFKKELGLTPRAFRQTILAKEKS